MNILTAEEMGAADRRSEEVGVSLETLMEGAGVAVARFCLRRYASALRVVVLCGRGNNGGDGFVAARVLAKAGQSVRIVLLGRMDEVKGEAGVALGRLRSAVSTVIVNEVVDEADLRPCAPVLEGAELLIDAL